MNEGAIEKADGDPQVNPDNLLGTVESDHQEIRLSRVFIVGDADISMSIFERMKNYCMVTIGHSLELAEQEFNSQDLIVVALDTIDPYYLRKVNRTFYGIEAKVLYVTCDLWGGAIGPCVIRNETACYECFVQRRYDNSMQADFISQFKSFVSSSGQVAKRRPAKVVRDVVATLACMEVLKILSGFSFAESHEGQILVDAIGQRMEMHSLLRHPFCPVCGRGNSGPQEETLVSKLRGGVI